MSASARPKAIKIHKESRELELVYADETYRLSHEFLRVHSPSAEVRGHGRGQEVLQYGKRDVSILDVVTVGHYALQLIFSDDHESGIYSWGYLQQLCLDYDKKWEEYLQRLEEAGKSRDSAEIFRG